VHGLVRGAPICSLAVHDHAAREHEPSDEPHSIHRPAIPREFREDAATTDLEIDVTVFEGDVTLRGTVPFLEDTDAAAEVAVRVPGVSSAANELIVAGL
jgi:hypothetical protein